MSFSALQRAENSSIATKTVAIRTLGVSVLFSEPKIPQSSQSALFSGAALSVSVLFSEPKIPQYDERGLIYRAYRSFSALQRAENSSIDRETKDFAVEYRFQCSSASRKFLNRASTLPPLPARPSFSALQRAENSSIGECLNWSFTFTARFSALQRAENSSIMRNKAIVPK